MWHKMVMRVRDSALAEPTQREVEIESASMEQLLLLVASELLAVYDGSDVPHTGGLLGCLHASLELSSWESSTHCVMPGVAAQRFLHAMRTSATDALFFGSGLLKRPTQTGRNGSSQK